MRAPRLLEFINEWGLRQDIIAEHIHVSRGTFGSKMRHQFYHHFNAKERAEIVAFLNSIPRVTEADLFEDD